MLLKSAALILIIWYANDRRDPYPAPNSEAQRQQRSIKEMVELHQTSMKNFSLQRKHSVTEKCWLMTMWKHAQRKHKRCADWPQCRNKQNTTELFFSIQMAVSLCQVCLFLIDSLSLHGPCHFSLLCYLCTLFGIDCLLIYWRCSSVLLHNHGRIKPWEKQTALGRYLTNEVTSRFLLSETFNKPYVDSCTMNKWQFPTQT